MQDYWQDKVGGEHHAGYPKLFEGNLIYKCNKLKEPSALQYIAAAMLATLCGSYPVGCMHRALSVRSVFWSTQVKMGF